MDIQLTLDQINQRAWNSRDASREFLRSKSWIDPGEKAAFDQIAEECRGEPLLDIGIGAGRTIPLMMQISSNYTGIDYTAKLLEHARTRYPDLNLYHMDARDMSGLPTDHYGFQLQRNRLCGLRRPRSDPERDVPRYPARRPGLVLKPQSRWPWVPGQYPEADAAFYAQPITLRMADLTGTTDASSCLLQLHAARAFSSQLRRVFDQDGGSPFFRHPDRPG
jgi:hypothetical protein